MLKSSNRSGNGRNRDHCPFDEQTSFQMLDSSKMVFCTASELSILSIPSLSVMPSAEDMPSEFVVHRRARSDDVRSRSMFSSFFGSAALNRSAPSYCCTATHQPVASRTIIGVADNMGHLELYLLSTSSSSSISGSGGDSVRYQVVGEQSVKMAFVPPGGTRGGVSNERLSLLIHGYAPRDGVCWFTVLLFYAVEGKGGGAVLQCAYRKNEDKLEVFGEFEPLNGIPVQNVDRIDAAIYDRFLWCGVVRSGNGGDSQSQSANYELFFCDFGHYLDKWHRHGNGATSSSATKWKFQRMWKRSEYISRISIESEFKFDCFYQQFAATLDRCEWTTSSQIEATKRKMHELVLHFWAIRLVDDPTMELDPSILEHELRRYQSAHGLGPGNRPSLHTLTLSPWNRPNPLEMASNEMQTDGTVQRIEFESKLKSVMQSVLEQKRCNVPEQGFDGTESMEMDLERDRMDNDNDDEDHEDDDEDDGTARRKEAYLRSVWKEYSLYFGKCLDSAKSGWKWTGMGSIALSGSGSGRQSVVAVMKQNGFSVLRRMDYAEQIEVYFDRMEDESDELTDFDEPPIRLHKFVAWCQRGRAHWKYKKSLYGKATASNPLKMANVNRNDLYHWFVACSWFYHQNEAVLNHKDLNLDDLLISSSINQIDAEFQRYLESDNHIQSHTAKQIGDLFLIHKQQIAQFLDEILDLLTEHDRTGNLNGNRNGHRHRRRGMDQMDEDDEDSSRQRTSPRRDYLYRIWTDTELMSCIESSFGSLVAARYSLLRSVLVTFLFLRVRSQRMAALLDLLKGYFILSFLASSIYERKQNVTPWNHQQNGQRLMTPEMASLSSFRSGLLIGHYLRYLHAERDRKGDSRSDTTGPIRLDLSGHNDNGNGNMAAIQCSYLSNPLQFVEEMVWLFLVDRNRGNHHLMYNAVQFLFCERQFCALQKLLSYIDGAAVSPLFQYLMARCHLEMERVHRSTSTDRDAVRLFEECCLKLQAMNRPFDTENERRLLGLVLTANNGQKRQNVDIYHLAPSEFVIFPEDFVAAKRAEDEERKQREERRPVVLSVAATESILEHPEYEWSIATAYYFHVVELYKHCGKGSRPKMVIKFAQKGIEWIDRHRRRRINKIKSDSMSNQKGNGNVFDVDDDDEKVDRGALRRVSFYGNVSEKEAERLWHQMDGDLECILLSIYKWRLMLEIVSESLKMERYGAAYRHLMRFEDWQSVSALSAMKEFVAICCQNKRMAPILENEWDSVSNSLNGDGIEVDGEWRRHLLSLSTTNNIDLKPRSLRNLLESMLYRLALQYDVADSFCFDLLFTFSMKHRDYHLAAKYMVEYALRIEQCLQKKSASTQRLQHHCLCHVLSAMDLMDGPMATKYLLIDFKISNDVEALGLNVNTKFITFRQVRSWYILIESKLAVFALFDVDGDSKRDSNRSEHDIANLNVIATANELHSNGLYAESLALRREFDCDCSPVFDVMINRLLLENGASSGNVEWDDLEEVLAEYDGVDTQYRYTLGAMKSILTLTAGTRLKGTAFVMPSFMMRKIQSLEGDKEVDLLVVPLIEMLCEFGHILEAVRTLCFALNLTQISMKEHRYSYQDHCFWKVAQRVFAQCNVLHLENEQNTLMKALAHWIQGVH